MKCPNCGAEINDGSVFCTSCGEKIESPSVEEVTDADTFVSDDRNSEPEVTPTTHFPSIARTRASRSFNSVETSEDTTVVESAPQTKSVNKKPSSAGKTVLTVVVALVLLCAAGFGGWMFYKNHQQNARAQEVTDLEKSYSSQIDAVDVDSLISDGDRSALLAAYNQLADIQNKISADQKDGKFTLSDGNDDSHLKDVTSSITDKQKKIFDWFLNDYKTRLRANSVDASATADNSDATDLNNKLTELKNLQNNIEDEKAVWESNTDKDYSYASFGDKINGQVSKITSLLKGKENQQKQDTQASKSAVNKWVGTYTGIGTDGKKLEIVLKSDGTVTYREGDNKTTEGTWSGDENTVKISFGGRISTRSEPFTITSKDGGRTIAVSSDSGTWQTDYLTKR
ncbi:hypothetical protein HMPREF1647_05815 [Lancefieldella parvula DNF00906]|uniref:zinc-ribbon domain-containing protein n=1 Tax=Lancefieldella parvula TaxID=1382 RepID=UPI00050E3F87|nr:zinc-ribbon domain-containing protein [Lancefieldella parvula]KGF13150.1 hypothetical protein HMPREF1647_05815 [Lancefieldella parvula DNF00906]